MQVTHSGVAQHLADKFPRLSQYFFIFSSIFQCSVFKQVKLKAQKKSHKN